MARRSSPGRLDLIVSRSQDGLRLLDVLIGIAKWPPDEVVAMVKSGRVWVGGKRVQAPGRLVASGQRIVIQPAPSRPALDVDLRGRILHLDEHVVVLDKPAGMPSVPTPGTDQGVVTTELARTMGWPDLPIPVHRLDRDTSGVMVLARDRRTARVLQDLQMDGRVRRWYLAITVGRPKSNEGLWRWPIRRAPKQTGRFEIHSKGKHAETRFRVEGPLSEASDGSSDASDGSDPGLWLVKCVLVTGRTHQIRLHASQAGCPIFVDRWYGGPMFKRGPIGRLRIGAGFLPERIGGLYLHSTGWSISDGPIRLDMVQPPDWESLFERK